MRSVHPHRTKKQFGIRVKPQEIICFADIMVFRDHYCGAERFSRLVKMTRGDLWVPITYESSHVNKACTHRVAALVLAVHTLADLHLLTTTCWGKLHHLKE